MCRFCKVWIVGLVGIFVLGTAACVAQTDSSGSSRAILKRVVPAYPPLARQVNARGNVRVEAEVSPDGSVKTVTVKGGHPILVDAAETAIRKWNYAPSAHETTEFIEIHFDPS
jgi:TonB family protein